MPLGFAFRGHGLNSSQTLWQRIFIEIIVRYMRENFGGDFLASWMDCVPWGVTSPHTSGGDFDDSVYPLISA